MKTEYRLSLFKIKTTSFTRIQQSKMVLSNGVQALSQLGSQLAYLVKHKSHNSLKNSRDASGWQTRNQTLTNINSPRRFNLRRAKPAARSGSMEPSKR